MFQGTSRLLAAECKAVPCSTRLALTPLPDSSLPWGRGSSKQLEEKEPEGSKGVVGVATGGAAAVDADEIKGDSRVDW